VLSLDIVVLNIFILNNWVGICLLDSRLVHFCREEITLSCCTAF